MNLRKLFYLFLIIPILFINQACSEDETTEPPTINETEVLAQYLEGTVNFVNSDKTPAMIAASAVYATLVADPTQQVILDIRSATDYAAGHIEGAVNVALKDIVTYYETNSLASKTTVVVACYSGQTAGFAVGLLRLLGYTNVYDLKFGMCSWNDATASGWKNAIANGNAYASQFVTTATDKNAAGTLPTLSTGKTTGAEILKARVTALLATADPFGDAKISASSVFSGLSSYYIVNYWSATDYATGHIPGAVQYTPKADLNFSTLLKTLPINKPSVVYCYTGQTSAHIAAYLRVLGYDAKSLLYGVNGMSYDAMPGTKFSTADINSYPLVQ
ncbi:MAG: rhodanese-like domain-containing protein [bacterium]